MQALLRITKALADETRVRLLMALESREVCVCQLIELVDMAPSTVSKHLALLRAAGLIDGRKSGRWMHYRHAGDDAPEMVREALAWVRTALRKNKTIIADARKLAAVLKQDAGELSRKQCCR